LELFNLRAGDASTGGRCDSSANILLKKWAPYSRAIDYAGTQHTYALQVAYTPAALDFQPQYKDQDTNYVLAQQVNSKCFKL
jgi:hypothetical protein